ncbi:MAG: hypothetical protein CVV27_20465 [Candidatus Melainabacteria bacterium HGW-Melainabacteria-1]|nr:MAG: hypothetical protein CVV27_20465 [Candidatus Melainabacteria bacterium HGW-Melainabacteria-1]
MTLGYGEIAVNQRVAAVVADGPVVAFDGFVMLSLFVIYNANEGERHGLVRVRGGRFHHLFELRYGVVVIPLVVTLLASAKVNIVGFRLGDQASFIVEVAAFLIPSLPQEASGTAGELRNQEDSSQHNGEEGGRYDDGTSFIHKNGNRPAIRLNGVYPVTPEILITGRFNGIITTGKGKATLLHGTHRANPPPSLCFHV